MEVRKTKFEFQQTQGKYFIPHIFQPLLYWYQTFFLCGAQSSRDREANLCHLLHKLIGFYNRDGNCLQRGTDWIFK